MLEQSPASSWEPQENLPAREARKARPQPRLAFVLPGTGAGGSEHVVTLLSGHFARQGWAVTLLTFDDPATEPYYGLPPGVRFEPLGLPPGRKPLATRLMATRDRIARLRSALIKDRPDLVISFLTRTNVLALMAARPLGIPVIVSERNNPAMQDPGYVWSWLRRRLYPRAFGLVTMTASVLGQFPPKMRRRGWVIPNHARKPAHQIRLDPRGRNLVAVGRLVDQKGFDLLLQAFARVVAVHPDWHLTIWGEGPDRAALEALAVRLGIVTSVSFPGNTEQPGGWIAGADAFVLSSRYEGWGLVVGEALAAGLPTVAFDCPFGPAEMIDDEETGLLVPAADIDALAHALCRLLGDFELRKRLAGAGRDAMQRFRPDAIVAQWQAVVETALAEKAGRIAT